MPIQDIVNVEISIQSAGLGQADFGTPIVLGLFTSPQNTAFGSDLTAELTPTTWRSVLTGLGFSSSDAAWLAFASLFGQARRPSLALIARRATPVAQAVNVNVDGAGDGTYTVSINGVDFDFVASSNTATQIKDGLILAINAGSEPVTAASVDSDTLSLTADTAGVPFTVALSAPSDDLSSSVITANTGIDTDLAAIEAERSDWYFVMETSRVLETQQVAVEAIESFGRPLFGLWQTDDTNAQGSSGNTDLGGWIQVNGYARSFAVWHDSDVEFVDTGLVGLLCSTEPGTYSWANQQVAGIEGIVPTSTSRLTSKGYIWLERYQAAQVNATRTGTPSGTRTWPDLVWGVDYLRAQIETDQLRGLLNASQNPGKIPYSDQGGAQIVGTLRSTLQRFADSGFLVADSIQAATITKAQQTSGNQAARKWAGVTFSATAQGAINTLEITGVINQ